MSRGDICPFVKGDLVIAKHDSQGNDIKRGWIGIVEKTPSRVDDMIHVKYLEKQPMPREWFHNDEEYQDALRRKQYITDTCCYWWRFDRYFDLGKIDTSVTDVKRAIIGTLENDEYLWKSIVG